MIAELHQQIQPDPWRHEVGFSPEVEHANEELFRSDAKGCEAIINAWLQSGNNQSCLFGRSAAKLGLISYCVLTENDLVGTDEDISNKIQAAREEWTAEGFKGQKSAFIILAVSRRITYGLPDSTVKKLAKRLGSLYLQEEVQPDQVHLDEVFLEMPNDRKTTWRWKAGVNYFCAQGDKRWWQDHRIPGGMAFSINSVGHMVKSGRLAVGLKQLEQFMSVPEEERDAPKIDSLARALPLAMLTINNAADAVSGKATQLLPLPVDPRAMPVATCPYKLPPNLTDRNFCEYSGHYHTDHTLPSEYFLPNVERPTDLPQHSLDFTYLFHKSVDNPAFSIMGEGQPIRSESDDADGDQRSAKSSHSFEEVGTISKIPRLAAALGR